MKIITYDKAEEVKYKKRNQITPWHTNELYILSMTGVTT